MQKNQNNADGMIRLTELELLKFLFSDIFPIISKDNKKTGNNINFNINNSNNKKHAGKKFNDFSIDGIIKIEEAISRQKFFNKTKIGAENSNVKISKISDDSNKKDNFFFYNAEIKNVLPSNACPYGISISYENNGREEKLGIEINDNKNNGYKISILDKKENINPPNGYSIKINYGYNNNEEKLNISYGYSIGYLQKHIEGKNDFTERVPLKWLNVLPETMMGGVLGFTYIGDPSMGRRADLTGKTARMVDIHESIHTPDEYETRVLTEWIISKFTSRYIK